MAKKILILRYGAYGDMLYLLPLVDRILEAGNIPYLHTGFKALEIFRYDTRFAGITFFEPTVPGCTPDMTRQAIERDFEQVEPDELWNMSETIETLLIPRRGDERFSWPIRKRRKETKHRSFYNFPLAIAGFQHEFGRCGTMALTEEEIAWGERFRERHRDQFLVLMPVSGTTYQKRFPFQREVARKILEDYPDAVIYLCADPKTLERDKFDFGNGRIYAMTGASFRQSLVAARYADYVIGPETGLLVGAGMWGTPKTMLCTTASVFQCTDGQRNDFSLQAQIECSPCHLAIYEERDCLHPCIGNPINGQSMTVCNNKFSQEKIESVIQFVYENLRYRREEDGAIRTAPFRVSGVLPDLHRLSISDGDLQQGVPGEIREIRADGARPEN